MPGTNPDKMLAILREQCALIPDRADGYQRELLEALADVVRAERDHKTRSIDIQKQVTAYCERLGDFLAGPDSHKRK